MNQRIGIAPVKKRFVVIREVRWYHRLWNRMKTFFGKEAYICEVHDLENYHLELVQMWLCPGCKKYVDWDKGCAHEDPKLSRLCDECFVKGGHLEEAG
jgi:hypothetical protein